MSKQLIFETETFCDCKGHRVLDGKVYGQYYMIGLGSKKGYWYYRDCPNPNPKLFDELISDVKLECAQKLQEIRDDSKQELNKVARMELIHRIVHYDLRTWLPDEDFLSCRIDIIHSIEILPHLDIDLQDPMLHKDH